jgi:molybdopterin adenylyltransferase
MAWLALTSGRTASLRPAVANDSVVPSVPSTSRFYRRVHIVAREPTDSAPSLVDTAELPPTSARESSFVITYARAVTHIAKVLTVSDSVAAGRREDLAGPILAERLRQAGFAVVEQRVIPDGIQSVASALLELATGFSGLIVTTGGTGFSPRDLTPEATMTVLDREAPGLDELMRSTSPFGALSRGRSGVVGNCLVLNTPGSPKGALECIEAVIELVPHALALLTGEDAPHPPETGGRTSISS